jgi:hypothetical protein
VPLRKEKFANPYKNIFRGEEFELRWRRVVTATYGWLGLPRKAYIIFDPGDLEARRESESEEM